MWSAASARARKSFLHILHSQSNAAIPDLKNLIAIGKTRDQADRFAQNTTESRASLNCSDIDGIIVLCTQAGDDVTDGHLYDTGFAEGWKNLLDIAQEGTRGTNDEHSRTLKFLALRVEKIGSSV